MSWFGVLSDHHGPCEHEISPNVGDARAERLVLWVNVSMSSSRLKMKHLFSAVAACVCALALLVAVPSTSFGGSGHGYKRHHGYKHNYGHRRHYGYGYRHRGYRHHGYRHYYGPSYFYSYSYYGHRPYYGYSYAFPDSYRQPRVIYVEPDIQYNQSNSVLAAPPADQYQPGPPPAQVSEGCRMIREYQTQITVGGRLVDAYGDACLKADGSWERGQPKIVPE